jgi:hypothetical protein
MNSKYRYALIASLTALISLTAADARAAEARQSFGFNAPAVFGFGTRNVELTGGGAYRQPGFVHAGGSFSCLSDIAAPPAFFDGCLAGQGVRWDSATLIDSFGFKCTGADSEKKKTAVTGDKTVVLLADFYRQGDGDDESFTARMIVSENPIAPDDFPGVNVWIQGIGCGTAIVNFN